VAQHFAMLSTTTDFINGLVEGAGTAADGTPQGLGHRC
jgi:hypothetical protein